MSQSDDWLCIGGDLTLTPQKRTDIFDMPFNVHVCMSLLRRSMPCYSTGVPVLFSGHALFDQLGLV